MNASSTDNNRPKGRPRGTAPLSRERIQALLLDASVKENDFFLAFHRHLNPSTSQASTSQPLAPGERRAIRERVYCVSYGASRRKKLATPETVTGVLAALKAVLRREVHEAEILEPVFDAQAEPGMLEPHQLAWPSDGMELLSLTNDRLEYALLEAAFASNCAGPKAVRAFLASPRGALLREVARSSSRWRQAASFMLGKLSSIDLEGLSDGERRARFLDAMSAWRTIEFASPLPAPLLLPGVATEAPSDFLVESTLGFCDAATRVVPVPYRYRAALGLALANEAKRAGDQAEFNTWSSQVEREIALGQSVACRNPALAINLNLCATISAAMRKQASHSTTRAQLAASDLALEGLEELRQSNAAKPGAAKYHEWRAVGLIGRLLATRGKAARHGLFDDSLASIDQMLALRNGNAPFLALDPAYGMAFEAMDSSEELSNRLRRAGVDAAPTPCA